MAGNSKLDGGQVLGRAFDPDTDRLRTDTQVSATIGTVDVVIDAVGGDNIAIKNSASGNQLVVNADGSINTVTTISTAGVAQAATQTDGTQKSIVRGGAKGSTVAADVTSTSQSADRNALDVQIRTSAGAVVDTFGGGTQYADGVTQATPTGTVSLGKNPSNVIKAVALDSSGNLLVNVAAGGTSGVQYADAAARGTATGTLLMVDDGTLIQSASGDAAGRLNVNANATLTAETTKVIGTVNIAASQAVTANAGTNLNTSALNLETTQTAMSAKLPATLGQKAMVASMAVVLSSDQSSVPVAATLTAETTKVIGTVNIAAAQSVTANAGTNLNTSALALDATLTGGTTKAIARGAAKGTTTAADITSTIQSADRQGLDVQIRTSSGAPVDTFGGGTQFADGAARGTATGTLLMVDDGTNIQSALGTTAGVLKVDLSATTVNATAIKVDGSAVTQPVSGTVTVNALTNASIVKAQLQDNSGAAVTLGQQLAAASLPVVLTAAQISTLTPLTSVTANAGTNLNTSALNLETTQTAMSAKLPATLGQKAMAASMAVTLASDQASIPVAATLSAETTKVIGTVNVAASQTIGTTQTDTAVSGTISATDALAPAPGGAGVLIATAPTANSFVAAVVPGGSAQADIQITGTATGTYYFEGSMDSTNGSDGNWIAVNYRQTGVVNTVLGYSATAAGVYRGAPSAFKYIRVRNVGGTTPSNPIIVRYSNGSGTTFLNASIPAGTNVIGKVSIDQATPGTTNLVALAANQSVNNAQIAGVATATGNGIVGAGVQRVSIASDNTAFSVNANAGTNLNTSALNLETTQTAMSAKLPATLGQKAMAASMAVTLASDQASVPVAATLAAETTKVIGTVNVAASQSIAVTQATGTNLHTVVDSGTVTTVSTVTNLSQMAGAAISMGTGVRGAGVQRVTIATDDLVPVTGTITAVTAITNALPAGTNLMGKVGIDQTTVGTTNAVSLAQIGATTVATGNGVVGAGVQRVSVASDNTAIPVAQQVALATGNITTQNLVPAGTATAGSAIEATITTQGQALVQVTGTYTGALSLQYTINGTTWVTHANGNDAAFFDVNTGLYAFSIASATQSVFRIPTAGAVKVRITALSAVTGTATVTINATQGVWAPQTNTNINQNLVGGATIGVNRGVSTAGTQRTIAAQEITYRASTIVPLVVATTVNVPFFNIIGSGTKTVVVKRITVSGMTQTAVGYFAINVEKLSTASSAGTSTTLVATPLDANDTAATAVVKAYTVSPTKGALIGTLRSWRALWQATTATAALTDTYDFNFGDVPGANGITLRGTAQEIALTFPVVLASAGTLSVDVEWVEY